MTNLMQEDPDLAYEASLIDDYISGTSVEFWEKTSKFWEEQSFFWMNNSNFWRDEYKKLKKEQQTQ